MAHFTLQLSPGGPLINAVFGVSGQRRKALKDAGKEPPPDHPALALVDTGASATCVDPSILVDKLKLGPTGQAQVHTPSSGQVPHVADLYDVSLRIYGATAEHYLEFHAIPVMACDLSAQGIHALIGRDILSKCVLVYNGATSTFTLAF